LVSAVNQRNNQRPMRLVQITDCHLGEVPGSRLLDLDTDHSLQAVLALVRAEATLDALLVTGDMADAGSAVAYRRLLAATAGLGASARWLPGNHDDVPALRAALAGDSRLARQLLLPGWQIIMLDSTKVGEVGGELSPAELAALAECLRAEPERHALVCLHHQTLPVGCAWLDRQCVANADALWAVLDAAPQVRGVLSGHVHQASEQRRGGAAVFTSPSTCVQFTPGSDDFRVDTAAPGYRWLELHADGHIDSGVVRVTGIHFQVDLGASGY
jgi:Icc protein